ncbi:hypothetical protein [Streptomyces prasinopilosus]|uniref:hypothetical protein n=1 Tax=Streptomyces prasinopilosus TaxID=67344 RepID=UPI0006EBA088|nr:hypothetical protein [Streptomyces prasinopilosus]
MTTELTETQRQRRWTQARDTIARAMYDTYGQNDTDRSQRIADLAMDALADVAAEILTDGTMMRGLNIQDGVATLELEPAREILLTLVAAMRTMLDSHGAENYLETEITAPSVSMDLRDGQNPRDAYTVTIQRRQRPTPHEFRQKAERERDEAQQAINQALGVLRTWRDEHKAGPEAASLLYEVGAALTGDRDG